MTAGGVLGWVPKGSFTLLAGGRYSANSTTGRFQVTSGTIRFMGGAYDGITGEFNPLDGKPRYILKWPGGPGGGASTQYCNFTTTS
jgi:hypothetical protein